MRLHLWIKTVVKPRRTESLFVSPAHTSYVDAWENLTPSCRKGVYPEKTCCEYHICLALSSSSASGSPIKYPRLKIVERYSYGARVRWVRICVDMRTFFLVLDWEAVGISSSQRETNSQCSIVRHFRINQRHPDSNRSSFLTMITQIWNIFVFRVLAVFRVLPIYKQLFGIERVGYLLCAWSEKPRKQGIFLFFRLLLLRRVAQPTQNYPQRIWSRLAGVSWLSFCRRTLSWQIKLKSVCWQRTST